MKVLIVKNDGIGDLILVSNIISQLTKKFDQLDMLICEESRGLENMMPEVSNWFYVSRHSATFNEINNEYENINEMDNIALEYLSKTNYDKIICLRRFIRASTFFIMNKLCAKEKIYLWLYPTNISISTATKLSSDGTKITSDSKILHEIEFYKKSLGEYISEENCLPKLPHGMSHTMNKNKENRICVNLSSKGWTDNCSWAILCSKLSDAGYEIVLTGDQFNFPEAESIANKVQGVTNHAGKISLSEWEGFLRDFEYYIGNDTGISHIAMMVCDKVIIHHGGGGLGRFFPWPDYKKGIFLHYSLDCYDCAWDGCDRKFECLKLVKPDDIVNVVKNYNSYGVLLDLNKNQAIISPAFKWPVYKLQDTNVKDFLNENFAEEKKHKKRITTYFRRLSTYFLNRLYLMRFRAKSVPKKSHPIVDARGVDDSLGFVDRLKGSIARKLARVNLYLLNYRPISNQINKYYSRILKDTMDNRYRFFQSSDPNDVKINPNSKSIDSNNFKQHLNIESLSADELNVLTNMINHIRQNHCKHSPKNINGFLLKFTALKKANIDVGLLEKND